jgi:3-isopropylmalate/(R)-2-methylmalate dehydratase small subunit
MSARWCPRMDRFETLVAHAAPLPVDDVDTDIIFPARFLLITDKDRLGRYAFYDWRFDAAGGARDFVLARAPWGEAKILVAGANFGCGSSREHAAWALHGLGIRCVVAPSFGEIFHANCIKNGMLPVTLGGAAYARILAEAEAGRPLVVDLAAGTIRLTDGAAIVFALAAGQRDALLNGWDAIDLIRSRHADAIRAFEARQQASQPWLWRD